MRGLLFYPPESRNARSIQPLLATNVPEDTHAIDWSRFNGRLKGVRVALDPGHIGGQPWDERNGKYTIQSDGRRLSEGLMALQLSILLGKELRAQGAEVYIDRGLGPATARDFDDFADASGVFFQSLDLDARAERLWKFKPDLVLILHFDAHLTDIALSPELCNDTKAYVPGAFAPTELVDDTDRAFFRILWRNPKVWSDSLELSRRLVTRIHGQLGAPLATKVAHSTLPIEPGLFGRNLRLQRRLAGFVTSYVEALCYEDPHEFAALSSPDFKMEIDGRYYGYSQRLVQLAHALRDGVVDFLQSR